MKHIRLGLLGAVLIVFSPSVAYAANCTGVSYLELMQKLRDIHFPLAMLGKVHVDDKELRAQESFAECPPNSAEGETAFIYSWRPVGEFGQQGPGVSFTFFEFSSTKARDRMLRKRIEADARVQAAIKKGDNTVTNELESDVYYYVDPNSTKAFRVERDVQFVIE